MENIYIIYKLNFNLMENRISSAIRKESIGYIKNKIQAKETVEKLMKKRINTYKGWDDKTYPIFELEEHKPYKK